MTLRRSQATTCNNVLKIHLSIPIQDIANTMSILHRFIDNAEDLCRNKSDYGAIELTIKCKQRTCPQSSCCTIFNKIPRNRKVTRPYRKSRPHSRYVAAPFSPMNSSRPDCLKDVKSVKPITQNEALAHSSNLNAGFLGSRASETGCTSASIAANEMRTYEDPIDE
ncbi:Hypothetical protein GLP15_1601 [Giardia lamblia P15]|uniref:Uncharacterized protein n=1 Tax=Giardia intestinalis (strain P15) TaxID=658858 RepID=E1EX80_GIAIA|nr:Hypothetical protein GLP15_1601 [Giardia lamblia P15]